ncbi:hypothetical protein [Hyalangium versicolor]|uniref:hypothetical protein n=1 Tax=Hyalangium versicolor TaxID=2861190 RepID=UPI001CCB8324|nr:hypothetical protein [Hyalangium versicolor]
MEIETANYSASGPSFDACYYLCQRYDAERGYKPFESECWVVTHQPAAGDTTDMGARLGSTGWLTRLWRSPSGAAFVSSSTDALVFFHPDLDGNRSAPFTKMKLGVPLNGVWGLRDEYVLAWGTTYEGTHHLYRYDGKNWNEMSAPDFEVRAIHGLAEDLLYAVGVGGGVARWDGQAWKRFPVPTNEVLNSVFVAGPDEIYATGGSGSLLEGSAHGWGKIGEAPGPGPKPLLGVAKWNKELWVAAGQAGLFKRVGTGNQLECIKPNLWATGLEVGQQLLICCKDVIVSTADGQRFRGSGKNYVLQKRKGKALGDVG